MTDTNKNKEETFESKCKELQHSIDLRERYSPIVRVGLLKELKQLHDKDIKKINDVMTFCCKEKDKQISELQAENEKLKSQRKQYENSVDERRKMIREYNKRSD